MNENNDPFREMGDRLAGALKGKIKGKIRGIVFAILGALLPFLLIFVVIIIVIGGAASIGDGIKSWFQNRIGSDEATQEEIDTYINDPEYIYNALKNDEMELDFSNSNLVVMDKDTILRVFERIHNYNEKRDEESEEIGYGNRVEKKQCNRGTSLENAGFLDMDEYGEIEDLGLFDASYDTERKNTVLYRSDVEKELSMDGKGVFDIRWQDILVVCAMAARDNMGEYELRNDDRDIDATNLDDLNLSEYFLTNEEIDEIIDIFYYQFDYWYDPIASSKTYYKFKSFINLASAYRLEVEYESENTQYLNPTTGDYDQYTEYKRITRRVPAAAPREIHNGYIRYTYNYVNGVCTSRDKLVVPNEFVSACSEHTDDFDMDEFVELLELLPGTDDLVEYYTSFEKTEDGYMSQMTSTSDPDECSSIGVIYSPSTNEGDGEGTGEDGNQTGWEDWDFDTTEFIYYDYINGGIHRIAVKEPGKDYGIYKVHSTALESYIESDNLTVDQLMTLFENYSFFANNKNILFNSHENMQRTAETLIEVQSEQDISILYFLAIMRIENALGTDMGAHWNFFNIVAGNSRPGIPGHSRFADYTSVCSSAWDALKSEISSINTWYGVNYNQTNAFLFCFAGYTKPDWSLIYHSYCPAWDDCSFPWAAGSGMGSPTGKGWANCVGDFRYQFEQIVAATGG